jgi:hypothetical protein
MRPHSVSVWVDGVPAGAGESALPGGGVLLVDLTVALGGELASTGAAGPAGDEQQATAAAIARRGSARRPVTESGC